MYLNLQPMNNRKFVGPQNNVIKWVITESYTNQPKLVNLKEDITNMFIFTYPQANITSAENYVSSIHTSFLIMRCKHTLLPLVTIVLPDFN